MVFFFFFFLAFKRSQSVLYSEPVWPAGISSGLVCMARWTPVFSESRECRLETEKADVRHCASVWWRAVEIPSGDDIHLAASALVLFIKFNLCLVLKPSCFSQDGDHFHSPGARQGPLRALGALSSAWTRLLPRGCPSVRRARVEGWVPRRMWWDHPVLYTFLFSTLTLFNVFCRFHECDLLPCCVGL